MAFINAVASDDPCALITGADTPSKIPPPTSDASMRFLIREIAGFNNNAPIFPRVVDKNSSLINDNNDFEVP